MLLDMPEGGRHEGLDIAVTTPKDAKAQAEQEAAEAREAIEEGGDAWYFRNLGRGRPKKFGEGGRVYYIERGIVRGFCLCAAVTKEPAMVCQTTGRSFGEGFYAIMDAKSWHWIRPDIEMRGFMGWRYFRISRERVEVVGGWKEKRPDLVI